MPGEDGTVAHAQLTLGNGMIMLGSARDDDYGSIVGPPTPGGTLTQSVCVVTSDLAACYERIKASGADIAMELTVQHYGGSLFAVRDPEGQLGNMTSYDPWAVQGYGAPQTFTLRPTGGRGRRLITGLKRALPTFRAVRAPTGTAQAARHQR